MNHTNPTTPDEDEPVTGRLLERRTFITWLWRLPVLAVIGGAFWGAWEAYYVHFDKVTPRAPEFVPVSPQPVATFSQLDTLWSAVPFILKTKAGETPALALRVPVAVPGGISVGQRHYLAFSRVCTHLGCPVSLRRDLGTLEVAFNYRAEHPVLACPCHLSVFAPLEAGKAVSGPAREPLPRVQLRAQGEELLAVGLEGLELPKRLG